MRRPIEAIEADIKIIRGRVEDKLCMMKTCVTPSCVMHRLLADLDAYLDEAKRNVEEKNAESNPA